MSRAPLRVESPLEVGEEAPTRWLPARAIRWLLPVGVVVVTAVVVKALFATAPQPEKKTLAPPVPWVRVVEATPRAERFTVVAHGTVSPRTESDLVAEVRGRVVWTLPGFEAGGFFREGEELLHLDSREYQIAVARARAAVALAESEQRLAAADAARQRRLREQGASSSADLEQFESRALVAAAALDEVRAHLAQAELDLERTVVRAPFDGRVRSRAVDLGQFVSPGSALAEVYAVDYAEVRLPIRTDELAFLDVPLGYDGLSGAEVDAPVTLHADLGGRALTWPARLVRTEGEIDLRTRMLNVVARVEDPFARESEHAPLPPGLFVRAEIQGRTVEGVYVLPTSALRDGDRVFTVDAEESLAIRPVEVLRHDRERIVIANGLAPGERVIVSPLRAAVAGMPVHPTAAAP